LTWIDDGIQLIPACIQIDDRFDDLTPYCGDKCSSHQWTIVFLGLAVAMSYGQIPQQPAADAMLRKAIKPLKSGEVIVDCSLYAKLG
jgi:hypothetical protein